MASVQDYSPRQAAEKPRRSMKPHETSTKTILVLLLGVISWIVFTCSTARLNRRLAAMARRAIRGLNRPHLEDALPHAGQDLKCSTRPSIGSANQRERSRLPPPLIGSWFPASFGSGQLTL